MSDSDEDFGISLLQEADDFLVYKSWRLELQPSPLPPLVHFTFSYCGARTITSTMILPPETASILSSGPVSTGNDSLVGDAFFHIGLVALTWVWMALPCRSIRVDAGKLDHEQAAWWASFYRHTFAEFAVVNKMDESQVTVTVNGAAPSMKEFAVINATGGQEQPTVRILSSTPPPRRERREENAHMPRALCPLGGGKDSLVVHSLLASQLSRASLSWLFVSDTASASGKTELEGSPRLQGIVAASGSPCLVVSHVFDYGDLARCGFGTMEAAGHPWAALVCFDSLVVALILGFDSIAVGNERSANYGNGMFVGAWEVNHQFDKSFAFEAAAHGYIRRHLSSDMRGAESTPPSAENNMPLYRPVHYFSALQPLWEVQIAWLFSREIPRLFYLEHTEAILAASSIERHPFLPLFISCNESCGLTKW